MHVKVDRQYIQCTNKDDDNGAYQVYFKGYDGEAPSVDQAHSGTRLGVNNQGENGKVYLGRWDRGMPSNSNSPPDAEASFADVNVAGEVRFSEAPVNFTSGDIMAKLKSTGLELSDIRPLTERVDFHGAIDFSQATVTGLPGGAGGLPSLTENVDSLQLTKPLFGSDFGHSANARTHYGEFNDSMQIATKLNGDVATLCYRDAQHTTFNVYPTANFFNELNINKVDGQALKVERSASQDDQSNNYLVAAFEAWGQSKLEIGTHSSQFYTPVHLPKSGSSGHFTHCHVMEPDFQGEPWENRVGLAVESTGFYCVRNDSGVKVDDLAQAPGPEYAMTSATLAQNDCLGIISSVELVANQSINHEHGGVTISTPVAESDGYKVLRVAAAGDVFAWVCKPLLSDCSLPYLGGQYAKFVDGASAGNVFAVTDGKTIKVDGREGTISGREHTLGLSGQIILTASEATISFTATQTEGLTPAVLSGSYQKFINGVAQPTGVVINCNADYSFTWTEKTPSVEARIAALEAAWNEMTGPD